MPLFICRWQNGDFSAVSAASREEAMELLDEVGNADVADLFTVKNFMVHFQLKTEADNMEEPVPVELEGFGDGTYEMLCERVYSVYGKVSEKVVDDLPTTGEMPKERRDAALKKLNEALVTERMRKRDSKKPKLSNDPAVAELQEEGDVPRPVAEKLVKERRRRAIIEMPSHSDKVQ
jgi:predicted component of type VI protein secretion system